jgi:hypothetical protein
MGTDPKAAAKDLVPLAKAIFGVYRQVRGEGYVELPNESVTFFIYAAMAGVSHFLAHDLGLPSHMREAAYELAPEIARLLREEVQMPRGPVGS